MSGDTTLELREQLNRRERELHAVYAITAALHKRTTLDELEKLTLRTAIQTVGASAGSIALWDPKQEVLVFRYVINPDPAVTEMVMKIRLQPGQGIAGGVFQSGVGRITRDPSAEQEHQGVGDPSGRWKSHNIVTVPLKNTDGQPIGVMQVLNKEEGEFDENDLEVLQVLGIHAASAIETARLREEAQMAVIVNLIGDISHDVKNMVTPAVTGNQTLELMMKSMFEDMDLALADGLEPDEIRERVRYATDGVREFYPEVMEMTYEGAQQVQERVREIADAIKGEVAKPHFEPASINEVAESVAKALRMVAEKQGVYIDLSQLAETPRIEMDRKQVYNCLYNLINNAIPETPSGGRIFLTAAQVEREQEAFLRVVVRDTGKGMPEHVRQRLFTNEAVSTKVGGTGLGTRIVKKVVDAHHGTIAVESTPGVGTSFIIHFPAVQPRSQEAETEVAAA